MTSPRIAVAGCGHWGRNHVRSFAELGALAAVVDADAALAARLAAEHGAKATSWADALGDPAIAGVVIAAPAELHARLALEAFAAGKHVFVEKPLALTLADGEAMLAAAESAMKILMVGHLMQYHPAFVALRALVGRGDLGAVQYAYSHRLSLGKVRLEENALWSLAPHDVSMLLALFGESPTAATISGSAHLTPGIDDQSRLEMTFSGGRRGHVFASWLHPFKEQRLVVVGETGMAVFEDTKSGPEKLLIYPHAIDRSARPPAPAKVEPRRVRYGGDEPLKSECAHFLDCISRGTRPLTDGGEGLAVLRVLVGAV
jgi:UDP-2-acetamido-3-amino-2,3-dideoxy-glucuronate N-acetyltransferase